MNRIELMFRVSIIICIVFSITSMIVHADSSSIPTVDLSSNPILRLIENDGSVPFGLNRSHQDSGPSFGSGFLVPGPYTYVTQWGRSGVSVTTPGGIATDSTGNVYIANMTGHCIQKLNSTGSVLPGWGSFGTGNGSFNSPIGIAIDKWSTVYVVDAGNSRIQQFNSSGVYKTSWGVFGSDPGQFDNPTGIAVNKTGYLYVVDSGNHRIQVFNGTGSYLGSWGSYGAGPGEFNAPNGIGIGSDGNVYVVDSGNNRVQKFKSTGVFLSQFGTPGTGAGQLNNPTGIVVGADGMYISDSQNNRVQKFSLTGTYKTGWGSYGVGQAQFHTPTFLGSDSARNIYVSDLNNNRVSKFSAAGVFISSYGGTISYGHLNTPKGVTLDAKGMVYVVDSGNSRIQKFSSTGQYTTSWGLEGTGKGQFSSPAGIVSDGSNVYVADFGNNRIQKFSGTGTYSAQWGTLGSGNGNMSGPYGITRDSSGNLYVVDHDNYRVQKFNDKGVYLTKWGSQGTGNGKFGSPFGIAADSFGNVYVSDYANDNIQKFDRNGTFLASWGSSGNGTSQFSGPSGLATDAAGNVFVADSGNNRVQKFSRTGTYVTSIGSFGSENGQFSGPEGVVLDTNANVYVTDMGNNRIQVFRPNLGVDLITPASGPNTGSISAIILGTDFASGILPMLSNGTVSIPGTVKSSNKTAISCSFPLTGAPTMIFNLSVRRPDGATATLQNAFTVTNSSQIITAITPSSGFNSRSIPVTITGTSFRNGATVSLVNRTTTITGIISNRTSTRILCTFPITGATAQAYNLTVTNIDGTTATKLNAFLVKQAGSTPTITTVTPTTGVNTATVSFIINGTNFQTGATVTLVNGTSTKTVTGGQITQNQTKCSFPLKDLPAALYNLTVTNPDGTSATKTAAFTVTSSKPTISSVTPVTGYNSSTIQLTIMGTNFNAGCTVTLVNNSTSITGNITSFSPTKCTGLFNVSGARAGIYNLTLTNPGGPNSTKQSFFTLRPAGISPIVDFCFPPFGENTASLEVTVNGMNFKPGITITITNGSVSKTIKGTYVNDIQVGGLFPLSGLQPGMYDVSVNNTDGTSGVLPLGFIVMTPQPTITSLTPSSGSNASTVSVVVSGTKFVPDQEVVLVNQSTGTIIAGAVSGLTPTKFTGSFNLSGKPAGLYNLTIKCPYAWIATRDNCFTVQEAGAVPNITDFSPVIGVSPGPVQITVNGSAFRSGAAIMITNGTYSQTVVSTFVNSGQIKASLPLTGLPYGLYNVTVRNSDGTTDTRVHGFLVTNPGATITGISPVSGYNTSTVTVTITGQKFAQGSGIFLENGTESIQGTVSTLSEKSITGSFPLSGIPARLYNLTVIGPGNPNSTKLNAFTVMSPGTDPVISTISPASGFNTGDLKVTITGANFRSPTVFITQGSLVKQATKTASTKPTIITATLPLKGVPGGLYTVTVRNSDGVLVNGTDIFYVTDKAWISKGPKTVARPVVEKPGIPAGRLPVMPDTFVDRQIV